MNFSQDEYLNTTGTRPLSSSNSTTSSISIPRRISCGPGLDQLLNRIDGPPSPFYNSHGQLTDYSAFRASFNEDMGKIPADKVVPDFTSKTHKLEYESVRKSLIKLVPPSPHKKQHSEDEDSEESEVFFTMKITKPDRLIRRRRGSVCGTVNTACTGSTAFGFANNVTNAHANTTTNANKQQQKRDSKSSGSVSFFDEGMMEEMGNMDMNTGMNTLDASNIALAPSCQEETQIQARYGMANANHESFMTSGSDLRFKPRRCMDLRKKRKTMMNWLANQHSARNLFLSPDSGLIKDPQPPTFVRVIYLGGESEKTENEHLYLEQPWPSRCGARGWKNAQLLGTYQ